MANIHFLTYAEFATFQSLFQLSKQMLLREVCSVNTKRDPTWCTSDGKFYNYLTEVFWAIHPIVWAAEVSVKA